MEAVAAEGTASVSQACRFLEVNRTSFYAWRTSAPTVFDDQDAKLAPLIRVIFKKHRRRYGARRVVKDLRAMGHLHSAKKVSKVMQSLGLKAIQPKSFVPRTTDSSHRLGYSPNLLQDADDPIRLDQTWVGDITYVPLQGGTFCYLAMLMDLFSRRIIGWRLSEDMTEALVLSALRSAIKARQPSAELLHHTDRGGGHRREAVVAPATTTEPCCVAPSFVKA